MHASQYLVTFVIIVHSESHTVCLYACVILTNRGNWRQDRTKILNIGLRLKTEDRRPEESVSGVTYIRRYGMHVMNVTSRPESAPRAPH